MEKLEDYCKVSSIFNNLTFDKFFPIHRKVQTQYRFQKVIRGAMTYECVFIAQCVRNAMLHPEVRKRFTVGFIGCGAFGTCILDGLLDTGTAPSTIIVSSRRPEIFGKYKKLGVTCLEDNAYTIKKSRIVFIACLPSQLRTAIGRLKGQLKRTTVVVSILAGVRILTIQNMLSAADEQFLRVSFDTDTLHREINDLYHHIQTNLHGETVTQSVCGYSHPQVTTDSHMTHGTLDGVTQASTDVDIKSNAETLTKKRTRERIAAVNVCEKLILHRLSNDYTRVVSLVSTIQFLLKRLGHGTIATRVAIHSVLGCRRDTDLESRIKIASEELQFDEAQYQQNEPVKKRDRQAAQRKMKQQRRVIRDLTNQAKTERNQYLLACLRCYAKQVPSVMMDQAFKEFVFPAGDEDSTSSQTKNKHALLSNVSTAVSSIEQSEAKSTVAKNESPSCIKGMILSKDKNRDPLAEPKYDNLSFFFRNRCVVEQF